MTLAARALRQPCLSVRTRALAQKFHQRALLTRGLFSMRLCNPTVPTVGLPMPTRSSFGWSPAVTPIRQTQPSMNHNSFSTISNPAGFSLDSEARTQTESSSASSTDSTETNLPSACKWDGCGLLVEHPQLVQHIQQSHVIPQLVSNRRKCFVCLWKGCRVFRQPSVSSAWLENHILDHTDAKGKPFRCIFDGCNLRFSTSILLERHLQRSHMLTTDAQIDALSSHRGCTVLQPSVPSVSSNPTDKPKQLPSVALANKRSLRRRRRLQCYRVRRTDFLDHRTQCIIRTRLRLLRYLANATANDSAEQQLLFDGDHCRRRFPAQLIQLHQTKRRLRSTHSSPTVSAAKVAKVSTEDPVTMRKNRALLFTIPYRVVGQRLSEDNNTEYLVHWIQPGGPPPTWIRQNHFPGAHS